METNTTHRKTGVKRGRRENINQGKFRVFGHATKHLNFLHLKTKVDALIGVHKEGYKSIAKMIAVHISPKERN